MTILDALSWVSMALAMVAFSMKNELYLRLFTVAGCSLSVVYYSTLGLIPATMLNTYVSLACSYHLVRDFRKRRSTAE